MKLLLQAKIERPGEQMIRRLAVVLIDFASAADLDCLYIGIRTDLFSREARG